MSAASEMVLLCNKPGLRRASVVDMQDARVINSRARYLSPSREESLFPRVRDLIGREQTDNGGHEEKEIIIPTRARSETKDAYRGKVGISRPVDYF